MAKTIFILGGARSGKSAFAQSRGMKHRKVAYLATGVPCDREMKERIRRHRADRPKSWITIEEPFDLDRCVGEGLARCDAAILDCVGGWVTNLILKGKCKEDAVLRKVKLFLDETRKLKKFEMIIVSNETGLGLVPPTKLGREFRDIIGRVNQLVAKEADEVYFMIAGIEMRIQ
jgi:adenosylcobinamide kinase/adenosylcobinamide-phosphate guanylyltransferase